MLERKTPRRQQLTSTGLYASAQARRARHVKPEIQQEDSTKESVDAEAALYMKKLQEDWANINLIRSTNFNIQTNN